MRGATAGGTVKRLAEPPGGGRVKRARSAITGGVGARCGGPRTKSPAARPPAAGAKRRRRKNGGRGSLSLRHSASSARLCGQLILKLPDDRHLADLLTHLRRNGRIAYYVSDREVEVLVLDGPDDAAVASLIAEWDAGHPDAPIARSG